MDWPPSDGHAEIASAARCAGLSSMPSFRSGRDQMQRIMNSIPVPPRPGIDITTAAPAPIYDYWLGGHDHFAAGRKAG